jgi:hypothetical protein
MFEDQNVELLPARTVMGSHKGGGSRGGGSVRGGNGGTGGAGGTAVAVNLLNINAGRDQNNVAIADASGGNANGGNARG